MTSYDTWAVCECGRRIHAPHGSLFHATCNSKVCARCGRGIESHSTIEVARWVGASVWYKPWTWGDGKWEEARDE